MSHVYHRVPENMSGTVLYPMNRLPQVSNELHQLYKSGYEGREHLLERKLPYLNCLWNDVLHCSPVQPQQVIDAMRKAAVKQIPDLEYFVIDTESDIDMGKAVIFYRNSDEVGDIRFEKAAEADWNNVATIPQLTLDYYKEMAETGEAPFIYHGIPHFLYLGTIETKDLKRIRTTL